MSTPIIIRRWRDTGNLFAAFPTLPGSEFTSHRCIIYDEGKFKVVHYQDCLKRAGQYRITVRPSLREEFWMMQRLIRLEKMVDVVMYRHEMPYMRILRTQRWYEKYGKKVSA